jgi:hypothetical protein
VTCHAGSRHAIKATRPQKRATAGSLISSSPPASRSCGARGSTRTVLAEGPGASSAWPSSSVRPQIVLGRWLERDWRRRRRNEPTASSSAAAPDRIEHDDEAAPARGRSSEIPRGDEGGAIPARSGIDGGRSGAGGAAAGDESIPAPRLGLVPGELVSRAP